jgi:hypothetical protein
VKDPMEATSGRLIASTSRYPFSFDHRSITVHPHNEIIRSREIRILALTAQR